MFFLHLVLYFILSIFQISAHESGYIDKDNFTNKIQYTESGEMKKLCDVLPSKVDSQDEYEENDFKDNNKSVNVKKTFCIQSEGVSLKNGVIEVDIYTRLMSNDDYITVALHDANISGINTLLKEKTVFGYNCLENRLQNIKMEIIGIHRHILVLIKGRVSNQSEVILESIRFTNTSKNIIIYKPKSDRVNKGNVDKFEYYDYNAQPVTNGEDESKTLAIESESLSLKTSNKSTKNAIVKNESKNYEFSRPIFIISPLENTSLSSTDEASTEPKSTNRSTIITQSSKISTDKSRYAKLVAETLTESQNSLLAVYSTASDLKSGEDQDFWTPLTISLVTIASVAGIAIISFSVYKLIDTRKSSISLENGNNKQ